MDLDHRASPKWQGIVSKFENITVTGQEKTEQDDTSTPCPLWSMWQKHLIPLSPPRPDQQKTTNRSIPALASHNQKSKSEAKHTIDHTTQCGHETTKACTYQRGEGVEEEDGENGLGHHGEQLIVQAVDVAELHIPLGDSQPPYELHKPTPRQQSARAARNGRKRNPSKLPAPEAEAEAGAGRGARAHLVHDVRVGLQRDPALPHLVGARRRKKESGGA